MRCRIDEAEVGFDFGDAGGEAFALDVADEELAEEGSRDDFGRTGVEGSWEELGGVTGLWGGAHFFQERKIATVSVNRIVEGSMGVAKPRCLILHAI